jgi:ABC transporter DrrB family efflux protein
MAKSSSTIAEIVKPEQRTKLAWVISDSLVMIRRGLTHIVRNPDQLLSAALMPIMFFLLFRYVFGGAIDPGNTTYVNFLVAGILVQLAAFGATYTAVGIAVDLQRGIIDRFRSLPMNGVVVLVGHTVADLARNFISSIILIIVAYATGFRPNATFSEWLLALGLLMLFTFAISWLSSIFGFIAKSFEAVQWLTFVFIFPLTLASSAFAPTETMPGWLQAFANNQPVTHVVDAIRSWLVGTPMGNSAWLALIWCLGILAVFIPLSAYMFRRRSAH